MATTWQEFKRKNYNEVKERVVKKLGYYNFGAINMELSKLYREIKPVAVKVDRSNEWKQFVRDNYNTVKNSIPVYSMGRIMAELSNMYKNRVPVAWNDYVKKFYATVKSATINTEFNIVKFMSSMWRHRVDLSGIISGRPNFLESEFTYFKRVIQKGKKVRCVLTYNGKVRERNIRTFIKFKEFIMINSEYNVFDMYQDARLRVYSINEQIDIPKYETLRDGYTNCVFSHILDQLENMASARKKKIGSGVYSKLMDKANKLAIKYWDGVPKCKLDSIFEKLRISCRITDIDEGEYYKYVPTGRFVARISYLHSTFGHVDFWASTSNTVELPYLGDIKKQLEDNGDMFYYKRSWKSDDITDIWANGTYYKLTGSPFMEYIKNIKRQIVPLYHNSEDNTKNALVNFVANAYHVNNTIDFKKLPAGTLLDSADHIKSFTQFKNCKYYDGFPQSITESYRMSIDYKREELPCGFYEIRIYEMSGTILDKLGAYKLNECIVLPAPELVFLYDAGYRFYILYAVIGKKYDFSFGDKCFDKDEDGIPFYCRASGVLGKSNGGTVEYVYKCADVEASKKLEAYLMDKYNNNGSKYMSATSFSDGTIIIKKTSKISKSYKHVGAYITSYSRISTLEHLLKMKRDGADIIRIVSDGIYYMPDGKDYSGEYFKVEHEKLLPVSNESAKRSYISNNVVDSREHLEYREIDDIRALKFNRIEMFNGVGGSGKTYTAKRLFPSALYSTVSWLLSNDKGDGMNTVYCKLVGEAGGNKIEKYNVKNSVVILDEITMLNSDEIIKAINTIPDSIKIILIGDFNARWEPQQLKPIIECDNPNGFVNYIDKLTNFTDNIRSKCGKLSMLLREIRHGSKKMYNELPRITIHDMADTITNNDYILCSRRTCTNCNKRTECKCEKKNGINLYNSLKYKNRDSRYIFTQKCLYDNKKRFNGEHVYTKEKPNTNSVRYEQANTIHSVQGMTIEGPKKIYIDANNMWDANHLYVALSRAEYIEQLVIIC